MDQQAFSLVELLMAVAFSALLMTGVFSFYNTASQIYSTGISGQALQDGANIVLSKIIAGSSEAGIVYRLPTSQTYTIASGLVTANTNSLYSCGGTAQSTPCNTSNPFSELYFCQDNPVQSIPSTNCNYTDPTARWYYLNSTGTSVIYHHFTNSGKPIEEKIYTAPKGSSVTLRFSPATINAFFDVEIDVAVLPNLSPGISNKRITTSGAASTFVLLRNHP